MNEEKILSDSFLAAVILKIKRLQNLSVEEEMVYLTHIEKRTVEEAKQLVDMNDYENDEKTPYT